MLNPFDILKSFLENGINLIAGVPDSLLKEFCSAIEFENSRYQHIITVNEGSAIAIATGSYLATSKPSLVYMQNSGLGNAINPLVSLADKKVYAIPLIMMIGWRGMPGTKDEPQHVKQGEITEETLKCLNIYYEILSECQHTAIDQIGKLVQYSVINSCPVAFLVKPKTFKSNCKSDKISNKCVEFETTLTREQAIIKITEIVPNDFKVFATTGHISRELYESRSEGQNQTTSDFLTVGSMGYASQIAFGYKLQNPNSRVLVLDGDGAALMHMGGLATIGTSDPKNFIHIVLNNASHDSVGGQPTVAGNISLCNIALACGYSSATKVTSASELIFAINSALAARDSFFIEIMVKSGARSDLGRPHESPVENKIKFMAN